MRRSAAKRGRADEVAPPTPPPSGARLPTLDVALASLATTFSGEDDQAYLKTLASVLSDDAELELPVFPAEAMRLQGLISSPDLEVEQLAAEISRDPLMSGRFISVANSPMFGGRSPVTQVERAVVRVGLTQASLLVMAIIAQAKMFKVPDEPERAKRVQAHSLASAAAAQRLAMRAKIDWSQAFLAGLLHELGRVFLLTARAELRRKSRGTRKPSPALEAAADELLHAGFAGLIATHWGFPAPLCEALRLYDLPLRAPQLTSLIPEESLKLAYVLAGAERIADQLVDPEADEASEAALFKLLQPIGVDIDAKLVDVSKAGYLALLGPADAA